MNKDTFQSILFWISLVVFFASMLIPVKESTFILKYILMGISFIGLVTTAILAVLQHFGGGKD